MKLNDFSAAVQNTPVFVPVFRVIKVPGWAKDHVQVGQLLAFNPRFGRLSARNGRGINLGASYVEFIDYLNPRDFYAYLSVPDSMIEASLPQKVL